VLREHNAGNHQTAADAFLLWNKARGRVLPGLDRRRREERDLYLQPDAGV
jgi:lysozyme